MFGIALLAWSVLQTQLLSAARQEQVYQQAQSQITLLIEKLRVAPVASRYKVIQSWQEHLSEQLPFSIGNVHIQAPYYRISIHRIDTDFSTTVSVMLP